MKTKIKLMLMVILTLALLPASASDNADGYIRSSVYELESQLSRNLESQISQFMGVENLWVSLHLNVDHFSLRKEFDKNSPQAKRNTRQKFDDLPGLNISHDGVMVKTPEDESVLVIDGSKFTVEPSLILTHTESVQIVLYHKTKLDKKIERLIRSLIEDKMSPLKIGLTVEFNHRKAKALNSESLDEGKKIRFEPESFAKSFREAALSLQDFLSEKILSPLKVGLGVTLLILLSFLGLCFFFSIKALNSINRTLSALSNANNQISSSSHFDDSHNVLNSELQDELKTTGAGLSDPKDKIIEIHHNHGEVITSFFMDAMDKRKFKDIWCLSQILGDKTYLENTSMTKSKNFQYYSRFLSSNLYLESTPEDHKHIYQQLMSLMLYPNVYFMNSIRASLNSIPLQALGVCFDDFNETEKAITMDCMDSIRMASLINNGFIQPDSISKLDHVEFEHSSLIKFDKKVNELRRRFEEDADNRITSTLKYLNQTQFDEFILSRGLDHRFTLSQLFEQSKPSAMEFFKELSVDELCSLIPMLSEEFSQEVCSGLPDIKRARVINGRKVLNKLSFDTMARFHQVIWGSEIREEFKKAASSSPLKLAA
ncbi:MAG: hypothetical protein ACLGG0_13150 [Bacteriovoracia bacterium]